MGGKKQNSEPHEAKSSVEMNDTAESVSLAVTPFKLYIVV